MRRKINLKKHNMKNLLIFLTFTASAVAFPGCEFIGDIFKTGIWVGVIIVVAIIAVIAFIAKMFSKK